MIYHLKPSIENKQQGAERFQNIYDIYEREEIFWIQRARHKCLHEGDANTAFFQASASNSQNFILSCSISII